MASLNNIDIKEDVKEDVMEDGGRRVQLYRGRYSSYIYSSLFGGKNRRTLWRTLRRTEDGGRYGGRRTEDGGRWSYTKISKQISRVQNRDDDLSF